MILPEQTTIGALYDRCATITDRGEAKIYFCDLVERRMRVSELTFNEAIWVEKRNIGYYAMSFSEETRDRVERLFQTEHPIFGSVARNGRVEPWQALQAGVRFAELAGWSANRVEVR